MAAITLAANLSVAAGAAMFTDKLGNTGSIAVEFIGDKLIDDLKQSSDVYLASTDAVLLDPRDLNARFAGCILTRDQLDEMIKIVGTDNSSPSVANAKTLVRMLDIGTAKAFGFLDSIDAELSDEMIVMLMQGDQAEDIVMAADDPICVFDSRQVGSFFLTDLVTREPLASSIVEHHFGADNAADKRIAAE